MQYRRDKYGNDISVLGYGCMRFTQTAGRIDMKKTEEEIMTAFRGGVNYFDTAYIYGGSEAALGEILERNGIQDQVYIATKLPHYLIQARESLDKYFDEQLRRLRTDHVDYYLMHMLTDVHTWERLKELGILEWLAQKRESGAIRQVGFSYHGNSDQFCQLVDAYEWDFCQIQYNYMDENSQAGRRGLRYAHEKGLPVVIMEPLRGGRLARLPEAAARIVADYKAADRHDGAGGPVGYTPVQWALKWLWNQPEVTCVLSGMNSAEMVLDNLHTAEDTRVGELTEEDERMLQQVVQAINARMKVGCTGCGYCMPCPRGVDIPGTFSAYNRRYSEGWAAAMKDYFMCTAMRKNSSGASNCVECGKCEQHCPQHIQIRQELKAAGKVLENPIYRIARWLVKKMKAYSLFGALLLAFSMALGGCGAGADGPDVTDVSDAADRSESSAEEPTQLRVFYYSTSLSYSAALESETVDPPFTECLFRYCEKYPELELVIENSEPGEDRDMVLNWLLADISTGKGPDILVLSRRTLENLQDNGALAELSGALPEETMEQIFDSVLRQGRIGDGLYGIAWEASVETLLVPDKVWEGETWRTADVLDLLEECEKQGIPYERWRSSSYSLTAEQMLYDLALQGIEGIEGSASPLVDLEQGECFFDTPEFVHLLEVCKRYGEVPSSREYMDRQECCTEVESGKAMTLLISGNLKEFSQNMAFCENGYHCVGYPTENACGSYVNCSRVIAVNAGTEHYDVVVGFINELLSEQVQREEFGISSVRRDVLTENVVEHPSFSDSPVFMLGERSIVELEGKADGSSWVHEYVEILDRGTPGNWESSEIQMIVMEEAAAYFSADKSAEDVARIIQSRVSLYLAERQNR